MNGCWTRWNALNFPKSGCLIRWSAWNSLKSDCRMSRSAQNSPMNGFPIRWNALNFRMTWSCRNEHSFRSNPKSAFSSRIRTAPNGPESTAFRMSCCGCAPKVFGSSRTMNPTGYCGYGFRRYWRPGCGRSWSSFFSQPSFRMPARNAQSPSCPMSFSDLW